MPSQLHEALLLLFRNRPSLAPELLQTALQVELPPYTEARIHSADLTEVQPAEYRADLIVLLLDGAPVLGIIVEVQLSPEARADPELAVLSAMAHGRDDDIAKSTKIAAVAQGVSLGLDLDRARLYFDLIQNSLSEAARRALRNMNPAKYEYQSDFAKQYYGQGKTEGSREVITKQLSVRFGPLDKTAQARIAAASIADLNEVAERLLTAPTLNEALGSI